MQSMSSPMVSPNPKASQSDPFGGSGFTESGQKIVVLKES